MKTWTKIALGISAFAVIGAGAALAADRHGMRHQGMGGGMGERAMLNFEAADADKSGDVSEAEFSAKVLERYKKADANTDGKITKEEVAAEIQRMQAERMAEHMIGRFDTDGDGALTQAEIEGRQKKIFALLDRNDDGKIVKDEMPAGRHGGRHGWGRHGMQDGMNGAN